MSISTFLVITFILSVLFMVGVFYEEKLVEFEDWIAEKLRARFKR